MCGVWPILNVVSARSAADSRLRRMVLLAFEAADEIGSVPNWPQGPTGQRRGHDRRPPWELAASRQSGISDGTLLRSLDERGGVWGTGITPKARCADDNQPRPSRLASHVQPVRRRRSGADSRWHRTLNEKSQQVSGTDHPPFATRRDLHGGGNFVKRRMPR